MKIVKQLPKHPCQSFVLFFSEDQRLPPRCTITVAAPSSQFFSAPSTSSQFFSTPSTSSQLQPPPTSSFRSENFRTSAAAPTSNLPLLPAWFKFKGDYLKLMETVCDAPTCTMVNDRGEEKLCYTLYCNGKKYSSTSKWQQTARKDLARQVIKENFDLKDTRWS